MPLGEFRKINLSREEEINLVKKAQRICACKGDPKLRCESCEALGELIEAHLRWLFKMCITHSEYIRDLGISAEELMADAIQGFSEAIKSYKFKESANLISYSEKSVVSALLASDLTTGVIVIPMWMRQLKRRIAKVIAKAESDGKQLTDEEIAEKVKESKGTVRNAMNTVICDVSLDKYSYGYEDTLSSGSGQSRIVGQIKESTQYLKTADILHEDSEEWVYKSDVRTLMKILTEEEEMVLSAKLGLGREKLTIKQMDEEFGLSRRKTDRIYKSALKKMREKAGAEEC